MKAKMQNTPVISAKLILIVLGISLTIGSCKKDEEPPVAIFTFTKSAENAPVTVTFTNTSQNSATFLWNFGDGITSTEKDPTHTYAEQGQYTIALEAKNGDGKTNSAVQYITILKPNDPLPVASFTFTLNSAYAPSVCSFTNTTQNGVTFAWNFGDGSSSTEKSPNHTYNTEGVYNIIMEAKNGDGKSSTATITVTVLKAVAALPVVSFSFTGNTAFAPCKVSFTNTTTNATSYLWSFGDGTSSTEKNPKHLYSQGGTYNVILTAKNIDGVAASLTKQVAVVMAPTKANIKQVTLTGFPATMPNGGGWDSGSGPDPYYEVSDYPSGSTYYSSSYFSDITVSSLPKTYPAYTIILGSVDKSYQIALYDNDILGSEFMGGYYFKFRDFMPLDGTAYPTQINLGSSGVTFKLSIEWKP